MIVRCDQLKNKSSGRVTYGNPCYSIRSKANSIYFLNDRSVQCKQRYTRTSLPCNVALSLFDTMLNFVENLLENERGPMNDQDLTKTDYDPDRSLVLIEGLSHFLTNFLQNLASCQTSFSGFNIIFTIS
jgi:hypothetical protein